MILYLVINDIFFFLKLRQTNLNDVVDLSFDEYLKVNILRDDFLTVRMNFCYFMHDINQL